ncbi:MAG: histidine phosphatase family protein [Acidobacteria bacterium]|jgi:broad specificity phosphatase PhoE|nr:histidine phosphatase family protein [Acidobacteriota bacterium]
MDAVKKRILLVRHGTTAFNESDRLQGRIDNPLSDRGRQEAEKLAARLKPESIDAFFSSPLRRARETATIINRFHGKSLTLIPEFSEIDLGDWEGLDYGLVRERFADVHQRFISDPDFPVPGGESFSAVCARARAGLDTALGNGQRTILIAGHASVNRAILAGLLGISPAQARVFRTGNAALSRLLLMEDGARRWAVVDFWNSTSHLECSP